MASSTRPCPNCGETILAEARFCGTCGQALPPLMEEKEEEEQRGGLLVMPSDPGIQAPTASGVSASAQSASPAVPSAAAGPQSAAPTVPTVPAGPQGAGVSVPTAPGGAQTGSSTLSGAAKVTAHSLRSTLLGSVPGKVLTAVLAVVVVAGGATAVLAATGKGFGIGGGSPSSGSHPTSPVQSSSPKRTATTGPNGAPPDGASFTLTAVINGGAVHLLGNPQNLLLIMGGSVCGPHDNKQPFTYPDPDVPTHTDTTITTCSGSYKGGMLIYTETVLQLTYNFGGVSCTIAARSLWTEEMAGTFTSPTTISGTVRESHAAEPVTCPHGGAATVNAANNVGTWTATLTATP